MSSRVLGQTFEKRIVREIPIASLDHLAVFNHEGDIDIVTGDADVVRLDMFIQITGMGESDAQKILDRSSIYFQEEANQIILTSPEYADPALGKTIPPGRLKVNFLIELPEDTRMSLTTARGNIYVQTLSNDLTIHLMDGQLSIGDIHGKLTLHMTGSKGSISQISSGEFNLTHADLEMEDANWLSLDLTNANIKAGSCQDLTLTSSDSFVHAIAAGNFSYAGKNDSIILEAADSMDCKATGTAIQVHELHYQGNFNMRYSELQIDEIFPTLSSLLIESAYGNATLKFQTGTPYAIVARLRHSTLNHSIPKVLENIKKKNRYFFKASLGKGNVPVQIIMHYGKLRLN